MALNLVLPANLGTFVMLLMFLATIAGATFAGVIAGYVVQKIFYTAIGVATLAVPVPVASAAPSSSSSASSKNTRSRR